MRIDPASLLVVLAFVVPFIVELRTVAAWVGVDLSIVQTALIGIVVLGGIVVWALLPDTGDDGSGTLG